MASPPSQSAEDYLERIHELIEEKGYARVVDVPLDEALKVPKRVDVNGDAVRTARGMDISFGDEPA